MSDFQNIIDGSYAEGEEVAIEKVAVFDDQTKRVYNTVVKVTDQILGMVEYPESVVDALRQIADEIEDAFGGADQ